MNFEKKKKQQNTGKRISANQRDKFIKGKISLYNKDIKRFSNLDENTQTAVLLGDIQSDGSLGLDYKKESTI